MNIFKGVVMATVIFASAISFTGCKQEKSAEAQEGKSIGIQLYSLRTDMKADPEGTIQKVGKMGFTFVEAAGYNDGKFYGYTPEEFKTIVNNNGMKATGSHMGSPVPSRDKWDELMKYWDKAIEAHAAIGVEYIVQPSMNKMAYESLEGLKLYCDYFNAIGEKCNKKGIRFGYHNHANEFKKLEGEIIYDYMLKNTDPKKVMFQLDLYWIAEGNKVATDYFKMYPGRFESWHLKDAEELGASGTIDFKSSYAKREEAGMKYQVIEVERYNFEPLVSVEKSIAFVKSAEYITY